MGPVVEINARAGAAATREVFKELSRDAIVVLRDVPAIHALKAAITEVAQRLSGPRGAAAVADVFRGGHLQSLEALAAFYRTMRYLRSARYFSAGFSDLAANLGLPTPLLIDCGYCRTIVPPFYEEARARPEMFHPDEFSKQHPNEISKMLRPDTWGNAHRDIDVRHYNYQVNFWFPLHDLDDDQTLLLFPDVYRREIQQYAAQAVRNDPDSWGLGRALKVPLRFGDTLLFHSQQVHASPSHEGRNRFTCELRVAAATIDDNSRLYWRHFWNLGNFHPPGAAPLDERARQFLEPPPETVRLAWSLQGGTAQAVMHRLFPDPEASLAAGYRHRDARVLEGAVRLEHADWQTVIARLDALSPGEDLWLLVARLLLHQKHRDLAASVLGRVYGRTKSYFWPLEAGRVAAEAGLFDVAETAFSVAELRAQQSDVALDRYTPGMPPARNPQQELQLLPAIARRAASAFAARARVEKTQATRTTLTFDYRFFWSPGLTASFENYDILSIDELFVALPLDVPFHPEEILNDRQGVAIAESPLELAPHIRSTGEKLPQPRSAMWFKDLGELVFVRYLNGRYLVPKRHFPLNFAAQNILKLPGVVKIGPQLPADALSAIVTILAADLERQSQESGHP